MTSDPVITFFTALLCEPGAIDQAASLIRCEDFVHEDHHRAYAAMLELAQSGKPVDVCHLCDKLEQRGMSQTTSVDLVERLLDGDWVEGQIHHYAALVRKAARKRTLMAAARAAIASSEANLDPEEILCELQVNLWALQGDRPVSGMTSARDFIPKFLEQAAAERKQQPGDHAGLSTGLPVLDAMTTGIRQGELYVVGALPGRGKTAFGTQIAVNALDHGVPVAVFSHEMTTTELTRRVLGRQFGAWRMRMLPDASEETYQAIVRQAEGVATLPLYIDDSSSLTASELAARGRAAVREHGVKLIVVDYLQLLRGPERDIRERVGNAANILRQLAKDTQVPVVALSQLKRPGHLNDRPTMLDLKESGDIEAHAHTVLLLYEPMNSDRPTGEDEVIVGKQRNGPLGSVPVVFDTRTLIFKPRSLYADPVMHSRTGERDD